MKKHSSEQRKVEAPNKKRMPKQRQMERHPFSFDEELSSVVASSIKRLIPQIEAKLVHGFKMIKDA